ncbi:MAG: hypothetical protein R2795_16990 [Saprospiraceae bacterium]
MKEINDIVKELISNGQTREALNELLKMPNNQYHDDCVVLANWFFDIQRKQTLGTISNNEERIDLNKINFSILQVIEKIKKNGHSECSINNENKSESESEIPIFTLNLDEHFTIKGKSIRNIDQLVQIADCRKEGKNYNLLFHVDIISEKLLEFESLQSKRNATDEELERKHILREFLDETLYRYETSLFEYFELGISLIIDWYFNKKEYRFLYNGQELYDSVSKFFKLFKQKSQVKIREETQFDVINEKLDFNYKLYVDEEQVKSLLGSLHMGIEQKHFLTRHAGLFLIELQRDTIIKRAIPKHCYSYCFDKYFEKKLESKEEAYFNLGGKWIIGLA